MRREPFLYFRRDGQGTDKSTDPATTSSIFQVRAFASVLSVPSDF
jgi:hypothetical protein